MVVLADKPTQPATYSPNKRLPRHHHRVDTSIFLKVVKTIIRCHFIRRDLQCRCNRVATRGREINFKSCQYPVTRSVLVKRKIFLYRPWARNGPAHAIFSALFPDVVQRILKFIRYSLSIIRKEICVRRTCEMDQTDVGILVMFKCLAFLYLDTLKILQYRISHKIQTIYKSSVQLHNRSGTSWTTIISGSAVSLQRKFNTKLEATFKSRNYR